MKARGCADEEDCGAGGSAGSSDDIHVFLQRAVCLFRGKDQGCSVSRDGAGICRSRRNVNGMLVSEGYLANGKTLLCRALLGLLPQGLQAEGEIRFEGMDMIHASTEAARRLRGQGRL